MQTVKTVRMPSPQQAEWDLGFQQMERSRHQGRVLSLVVSLMLAVGLMVASSPVRGDVTDQQIADAVEDELIVDQATPAYAIDITANNGVITLTGSVDSLLAKQRAGQIGMMVRGARAVINRISVVPSEPISDAALRGRVTTALLQDAATDSYQVAVSVNDGKVILSGSVDSWAEKDLAATVASGVDGVMEIVNNINVDYDVTRSDSEIESEVDRRLHWSTMVDDALIDVKVNDARVTLSGTVGSAAEKNEARRLGWVTSVADVKVNKLTVAKWARDTDFRHKKYVTKTDKALRSAVNDALALDPRVLSFNIRPEVENQVVTLRGKVDNLAAKRAAEADARQVVGVRQVNNRIKVRPMTQLRDREIETTIKNALLRSPYVESFEVDVSVANGLATLKGTVDSYFEKAQADDLASKVNGVMAVINKLDVRAELSPFVYNPYLDHYEPYFYDWYQFSGRASTNKTDLELKLDIKDELFWSPFIDSDDVTVTVENGIATLTGTIESWNERRAGTENAFEGGATVVDNDLIVLPQGNGSAQ